MIVIMHPDMKKRHRLSKVYTVGLALVIALGGLALYGGLSNHQVITRPSASTPEVQVALAGASTREPQPTPPSASRMQIRLSPRASVRPLRVTLLHAPIDSMADVRLSSYERVPL